LAFLIPQILLTFLRLVRSIVIVAFVVFLLVAMPPKRGAPVAAIAARAAKFAMQRAAAGASDAGVDKSSGAPLLARAHHTRLPVHSLQWMRARRIW